MRRGRGRQRNCIDRGLNAIVLALADRWAISEHAGKSFRWAWQPGEVIEEGSRAAAASPDPLTSDWPFGAAC
jgi:hypothetical protein